MCQASTYGRVRARVQVLQNSGSRMVVLDLQLCQREITTDKIQERKNYRARRAQQYNSARVSTLTGSVPRKMAAKNFSTL